jgi:hypothetical protein
MHIHRELLREATLDPVSAAVTRDKLIILEAEFADPAYPGQRFFCWHCALMEGLLRLFPNLAAAIDVERVPWAMPRQAVIDLIGAENQSLPVLILASDAPTGLETGTFNGTRFAEGKDAILKALAVRHGLPYPHP